MNSLVRTVGRLLDGFDFQLVHNFANSGLEACEVLGEATSFWCRHFTAERQNSLTAGSSGNTLQLRTSQATADWSSRHVLHASADAFGDLFRSSHRRLEAQRQRRLNRALLLLVAKVELIEIAKLTESTASAAQSVAGRITAELVLQIITELVLLVAEHALLIVTKRALIGSHGIAVGHAIGARARIALRLAVRIEIAQTAVLRVGIAQPGRVPERAVVGSHPGIGGASVSKSRVAEAGIARVSKPGI